VAANRELPPPPPEESARGMDMGPLIRTVIDAVKALIKKDRGASKIRLDL
jgi:hypothetical protein